jgi:hypothetical protein
MITAGETYMAKGRDLAPSAEEVSEEPAPIHVGNGTPSPDRAGGDKVVVTHPCTAGTAKPAFGQARSPCHHHILWATLWTTRAALR